ncbi:glucarate dehydratase family protein [Fodinicola feengrottensis]|uniref:glucarate dehydratase n=1 Tax=Fodinicola feengrottensis TaxID=435914 RepID=A0ABN2INS6_9ACTN
MRIREVTITPVAFADPPLLNVTGVHEPYALRSILQLGCEDGVVGLGESYGDEDFLVLANKTAESLVGVDIFDLPAVRRAAVAAVGGGIYADRHGLTGGVSADKTLQTVYSFFEVAMLDAQGKLLGRPVVDLLGAKVRDRVDFSAYLFYKYAAHQGFQPDEWGEVLTPETVVSSARKMIDRYGFRSIKLKGGVFPPAEEIAAIQALRDAFPEHPLRIDPNGGWTPATSQWVAKELDGVLEYLEDPTPGIDGMSQVAAVAPMPLATNMCVVEYAHIPPAVEAKAVSVVLSDHHFWGGLRLSSALATMCETFGLGLSMHSNSHLGISLAAMVQLAGATGHLTYACDTHWPWKTQDVIVPGALDFEGGSVAVPSKPGLGVELDPDALGRLHSTYLNCGLRRRDDATYMRRYVPDFEPNTARW